MVLPGAVHQQRQGTTQRSRSHPTLLQTRVQGTAASIHALLPHVQAEDQASVVTQGTQRPLPPLPLADFARVHEILSVVWPTRAASGLVHADAIMTAGPVTAPVVPAEFSVDPEPSPTVARFEIRNPGPCSRFLTCHDMELRTMERPCDI